MNRLLKARNIGFTTQKLIRKLGILTFSLFAALVMHPCAAADFTDTATINLKGLDSPWTGEVVRLNGDVFLRTYNNGVPQFEFHIGPGGTLSSILNLQTSTTSLLAPDSDPPVVTDSVVQTVWWDDGVHSAAGGPPEWTRYNVNQAGTAENWFTPVVTVNISTTPAPTVDVYSTPQEQWDPYNRSSLASKVSMLTRYRLIGKGDLMIRKVMIPADPYVNGSQVPFSDLYIEGWFPLRAADSEPGFNALALSISSDGTPGWYYEENNNVAPCGGGYTSNPAWSTYGYAVAFNEYSRLNSTALGIAFPKGDPQSWTNNQPTTYGSSVLNQADTCRSPGNVGNMQVLPAFGFATAPTPPQAGAVLDQYLVVVAKLGMGAEMYNELNAIVPLMPAPRYFPPGSTFDGELANIVKKLQQDKVVGFIATTE